MKARPRVHKGLLKAGASVIRLTLMLPEDA